MCRPSKIDGRCEIRLLSAILAQNIDTIYKLYVNYTEGLHFSAFIFICFLCVAVNRYLPIFWGLVHVVEENYERTHTYTYRHTHTDIHTHGTTTVTIIKIICGTKDKQRSLIYGSTEAHTYTYTKPLNIKHMR